MTGKFDEPLFAFAHNCPFYYPIYRVSRKIGALQVFCYNDGVGVDVIEIYRLLPKIDCGQCSSGSCTAFARDVLEDCSKLSECTRLSPYGLMMIKTLLCQGK
jgi:ArsR family metal-binding transcriptional regulator